MSVQSLHNKLVQTLQFCRLVESNNPNKEDQDSYVYVRPKLTYRFDDVEKVSSAQRKEHLELEVRKRIVHMFKYVNQLMQEGSIIDFSIYRSSLEQVFKRMVMGDTM